MYQDTDDNVDLNNETGFFGSLSYKSSSKTTIKAQFGSLNGDTHDEDTFSIGADHKFAKNTKVFAFYTQNTYVGSYHHVYPVFLSCRFHLIL